MVKIRPFRAIRYNQKKITQPQKVVCPPYDVISKSRQEALYRESPHNFIRLILGKEKKSDNKLSNKYLRAKQTFNKWLKENILIREDKPAVYPYEQSFKHDGRSWRRNGFIALLGLEPLHKGVVFPHEKTFCKPKKDRLSLLKATQANLCPVFGLYPDPRGEIDALLEKARKGPPICELEFEGIKNRLWKTQDPGLIKRLIRLMRNKKIFIADGHHRYETACHYHKLTRRSKDTESQWIMMYFTNLHSEGLLVLPTHRVIQGIAETRLKNILSLLEGDFTVNTINNPEELFSRLKSAAKGEHLFGLCLGRGKYHLLKLKKHAHCQELDVTILHKLIINKILGLKNKENNTILYTRDEKEALKLVENRKYQLAFFMNPPSPLQISAIARASEKMPHKSTYFYPKPVSGLVINSLKKDALI